MERETIKEIISPEAFEQVKALQKEFQILIALQERAMKNMEFIKRQANDTQTFKDKVEAKRNVGFYKPCDPNTNPV